MEIPTLVIPVVAARSLFRSTEPRLTPYKLIQETTQNQLIPHHSILWGNHVLSTFNLAISQRKTGHPHYNVILLAASKFHSGQPDSRFFPITEASIRCKAKHLESGPTVF
jgi:hypothetical protein